MTTAHFSIFELGDLACSEQAGDIVVASDGAITVSIRPESPLASRLDAAVNELRTARTLNLRSETMREGSRVMTAREINPGEPLYVAAVTDTLSRRFGFDCVKRT